MRQGGYAMPVSSYLSRSPVIALLLTGLLLAGCSSAKTPLATPPEAEPPEAISGPSAQSPVEARIESWETLEVDEFNTTISEAVDSGKTWTEEPIDVVEQFIWGKIGGARYTWLEKQDNRVEWPDSTVITLTREGYADDSVRGDWHRVTLYRLPDGTWRLSEARRAFRCYRSHQRDSYGERLCL